MTVLQDDVDFLEHYGVKGQKWGVRRSKKTTGVSRARGAMIDRNDRMLSEIKNARTGKKYKRTVKVVRAIIGEEKQKRNWDTLSKDLRMQNKRVRAGELKAADRLQLFAQTPLMDLVITRRPV